MLNLNCTICTESFGQTDDVHITTCGHMFHFICVKRWLDRAKSCPQCRNKCTERSLIRVYFNLANLDVSAIDVGALQERLDNANLQQQLKEKETKTLKAEIKCLKEAQRQCVKTIISLEENNKKNDAMITSYLGQCKALRADLKATDELCLEVKSLKRRIETMDSLSAMINASKSEAEKLLKNEHDPQKLSLIAATLKRELRICEAKRHDLRQMLAVVQSDYRKEHEAKKNCLERISQLESENYQLTEKLKTLKNTSVTTATSFTDHPSNNTISSEGRSVKEQLNNGFLMPPALRAGTDRRYTISPTIKENVKKIEQSNSPYLNIKASCVGMLPLFKRINEMGAANAAEVDVGNEAAKTTTAKLTTLKISPIKTKSGTLRKTSSDISEKYSILKKPRLGFSTATASSSSAAASTSGLLKPLRANYVFDGFGGSTRVDPFVSKKLDEDKEQAAAAAAKQQAAAMDVIDLDANLDTIVGESETRAHTSSAQPARSTLKLNSVSNRLKAGGLRNFNIPKPAA